MKLIGTHTQEVAGRIVEAFQHPETLPQALAPLFIHRKDEVPCRKWSWHNQLITLLSGTADARGFKQWMDMKRNVKKGSHALWILAPCLKTIQQEGDEEEEKRPNVLIGFRSIPVFAVEDTEGEPLPENDDAYDDWLQTLPLLDVAQTWDIQVGTYSGASSNPLGYFRHGGKGLAIMLGVENLSTWAHEMVHAADHRLHTHEKQDRVHGEIVAELGGAVLLSCLGMHSDADLGGAYAYIEAYASTAGKDVVRACIEVLDRVCNCVKLILDTAETLQASAAA